MEVNPEVAKIFASLGNPTAKQLAEMTRARETSCLNDFATNRKEFVAAAVEILGEVSSDIKRNAELAQILGDLAACRFDPPKLQFDEFDNPV